MPRLPWQRGGDVFLRRAGGTPPPDWEIVDVDRDGTFRMWRTIARASRPPSPVGRFGGAVPPDLLTSLQAAAKACAKAKAVTVPPAPGASTDVVKIGSVKASWAEDQTPPPPWDGLAVVLRSLLAELASFPLAAVTVETDSTGRPRLRHLGSETIELDLAGATVRAVQWVDGVASGQWETDVKGERTVVAGPGWEHQLPFEHDHPPGSMVTAHVDNLLAFDGEFWRSCSAEGARPAGG